MHDNLNDKTIPRQSLPGCNDQSNHGYDAMVAEVGGYLVL
jgi:hypothetical protein